MEGSWLSFSLYKFTPPLNFFPPHQPLLLIMFGLKLSSALLLLSLVVASFASPSPQVRSFAHQHLSLTNLCNSWSSPLLKSDLLSLTLTGERSTAGSHIWWACSPSISFMGGPDHHCFPFQWKPVETFEMVKWTYRTVLVVIWQMTFFYTLPVSTPSIPFYSPFVNSWINKPCGSLCAVDLTPGDPVEAQFFKLKKNGIPCICSRPRSRTFSLVLKPSCWKAMQEIPTGS
jgi:hypothetical protein